MQAFCESTDTLTVVLILVSVTNENRCHDRNVSAGMVEVKDYFGARLLRGSLTLCALFGKTLDHLLLRPAPNRKADRALYMRRFVGLYKCEMPCANPRVGRR
jgi:hypothetical protein